MTDNIKIREEDKERLDELMDGDEISEYGELSYKDAVQFVLDQYEAGNTQATQSNSASSDSVTRKSAGSNSDTSDEVEAKIDSVRMEDGGGTRNNEETQPVEEGDSFPHVSEDVDTESLSAEELKERVQR